MHSFILELIVVYLVHQSISNYLDNFIYYALIQIFIFSNFRICSTIYCKIELEQGNILQSVIWNIQHYSIYQQMVYKDKSKIKHRDKQWWWHKTCYQYRYILDMDNRNNKQYIEQWNSEHRSYQPPAFVSFRIQFC